MRKIPYFGTFAVIICLMIVSPVLAEDVTPVFVTPTPIENITTANNETVGTNVTPAENISVIVPPLPPLPNESEMANVTFNNVTGSATFGNYTCNLIPNYTGNYTGVSAGNYTCVISGNVTGNVTNVTPPVVKPVIDYSHVGYLKIIVNGIPTSSRSISYANDLVPANITTVTVKPDNRLDLELPVGSYTFTLSGCGFSRISTETRHAFISNNMISWLDRPFTSYSFC